MSTTIVSTKTLSSLQNWSNYVSEVNNKGSIIVFGNEKVALLSFSELQKYQELIEHQELRKIASVVMRDSLEYEGDDDMIDISKATPYHQ